jgi:hypothetical protein
MPSIKCMSRNQVPIFYAVIPEIGSQLLQFLHD